MRLRTALTVIAREPLLHFGVLGVALFSAGSLWSNKHDPESEQHRIIVTGEQVRSIADHYLRQGGAAPTAEQLRVLTDRYIHDEILYREGVALGLDQEDEVVRRRIIQKTQFLLQDRAIIREPTDTDLAAFYWSHRAQYVMPETASFSHVYFSTGGVRDSEVLARAGRVLTELKSANLQRAPGRGDRFTDLYDYSVLSKEAVARLFGNSPFLDAVFGMPVDQWSGPFRSTWGWHLIYVSARQAPRLMPLMDVRERVAADYRESFREQMNSAAVMDLEKKYTVVRTDVARD